MEVEKGTAENAMSSRLGPLYIECDAPPYSVVVACQKLGFQNAFKDMER